ncbi:hypothetical protein MAPG_01646 [Magnaporthiopsis poae ATCC 64411]|uniref:Uncharacterized protein n=1 Tax=Magnaporthiopsis poae (strain ATCC 64411 / 73-15) TaxID=644358 RepID=A0A0C4DP90_MAGP6|nr:hypothetical protein MAPG_01646 [Magnaporthiopsis poae ATCC 64411]
MVPRKRKDKNRDDGCAGAEKALFALLRASTGEAKMHGCHPRDHARLKARSDNASAGANHSPDIPAGAITGERRQLDRPLPHAICDTLHKRGLTTAVAQVREKTQRRGGTLYPGPASHTSHGSPEDSCCASPDSVAQQPLFPIASLSDHKTRDTLPHAAAESLNRFPFMQCHQTAFMQ